MSLCRTHYWMSHGTHSCMSHGTPIWSVMNHVTHLCMSHDTRIRISRVKCIHMYDIHMYSYVWHSYVFIYIHKYSYIFMSIHMYDIHMYSYVWQISYMLIRLKQDVIHINDSLKTYVSFAKEPYKRDIHVNTSEARCHTYKWKMTCMTFVIYKCHTC